MNFIDMLLDSCSFYIKIIIIFSFFPGYVDKQHPLERVRTFLDFYLRYDLINYVEK